MNEEKEKEVVRFYTSTRRFPKLIGKLPTGESIPGGSYTMAQFAWAMAIGLVLLKTRVLWGTSNGFMNIGLIVGGVVGAAYVVGRMPATARNPLTLIAYIPEAWGAPMGRYKGKVVKLPVVERVVSTALIDMDDGFPPAAASPSPPSSEPAVPEDRAAAAVLTEAETTKPDSVPVPLSAVQSLLAGASRSS